MESLAAFCTSVPLVARREPVVFTAHRRLPHYAARSARSFTPRATADLSDSSASDTPPPLLPPPVDGTEVAESPTPAPEDSPLLLCLVCRTPLPPAAHPIIDTVPSECPNCGTALPRRAGYLDLTAEPARPSFPLPLPRLPSLPRPQLARQAIFQSPNVSFAYERGWRDGFKRAGFPGPDAEVDLALDFLLPAATLLDMSCATGIISRRLAAAAPDVRVVAADYSAAMLVEAATRAGKDPRLPPIDFVRADVAALPFPDAAFDAVHAGAALHCWPRLQDGLREILRVLAPGAGFFATTFANNAYISNPTLARAAKALSDTPLASNQAYRFFDEDELLFLHQAAGFIDVSVRRLGSACLVVQARAPL